MTTSEPPIQARLLALLALGLLAVQAVLGPGAGAPVVASLAGLALLLAWLGPKDAAATRALAALAGATIVAVGAGLLWQLAMAAALAIFVGLGRLAPALRPSATWRARGVLPLLPTLLVAGVTPFALTAWLVLFDPDLSDIVETYDLHAWPLPVLIAGATAFALANAVLEELLWRGLLQDRLEPLFGVGAAVALQGLSFGLQHWHGFPRGPTGALLAGSWGVMLGMLRRRSGGLLAPVVAHVVADAVIAALLILRYA